MRLLLEFLSSLLLQRGSKTHFLMGRKGKDRTKKADFPKKSAFFLIISSNKIAIYTGIEVFLLVKCLILSFLSLVLEFEFIQ